MTVVNLSPVNKKKLLISFAVGRRCNELLLKTRGHEFFNFVYYVGSILGSLKNVNCALASHSLWSGWTSIFRARGYSSLASYLNEILSHSDIFHTEASLTVRSLSL